MIADFFDLLACFLLAAACAVFTRSMSARVRPAPKAPIWRKSRRLAPSQNLWDEPRNRSMTGPSKGRGWEGGKRLRERAGGSVEEAGHRDWWFWREQSRERC